MRWFHTVGQTRQTRHVLCEGVAELVGNSKHDSISKHCNKVHGRGSWWRSCDDDSANPWKPRRVLAPNHQPSCASERGSEVLVGRVCPPELASSPTSHSCRRHQVPPLRLPCQQRNGEVPLGFLVLTWGVTKPVSGGTCNYYCDKLLEISYVGAPGWRSR